MDVRKVAKVIDLAVEHWPGQCYGIAMAMIEALAPLLGAEFTAAKAAWAETIASHGDAHPRAVAEAVEANDADDAPATGEGPRGKRRRGRRGGRGRRKARAGDEAGISHADVGERKPLAKRALAGTREGLLRRDHVRDPRGVGGIDGPLPDLRLQHGRHQRALLRGADHFALYTPVYKWTSYSWYEPAATGGGDVEIPYGPVSVPPGWQWLRAADQLSWTGKHWKLSRQWIGSFEWDSKIYPVTQ